MAFNLQTFRTRSLTAIVFVVVMLAGLLVNRWSFLALFSVIHFGCWIEYQKLVGKIDEAYQHITPLHKYGVMLFGWGFMLYMTNDDYHFGAIQLHAIGWLLIMITTILLMTFEIVFPKQLNLKTIGYSAIGLLYISLNWGLMMDLRNEGTFFNEPALLGWMVPIVLIASIWINDTMAYIVGSFIGKTPFSKISPKKTWEGTIGGMILCVLVIGFVVVPILMGNTAGDILLRDTRVNWFIIAALAAIFGTLGDLLESKIKRMADVKDSGQIMPGHGGFLDRFDSLLIATPVVWLYIKLFL